MRNNPKLMHPCTTHTDKVQAHLGFMAFNFFSVLKHFLFGKLLHINHSAKKSHLIAIRIMLKIKRKTH